MFYTYSFITTKQESIADVQKRKKRSQSIALQEIIISQRKRPREKERNKLQKSHKTTDKMAIVSFYLSIITLNVSVFNSPSKRQSGWMDKK